MTDKEKFKIIVEYIKDLSIETPSATTLLFVRENIAKYNLDIDISSSALKNNLLTIRAAENVVRILPPLNVKKNEIDLAMRIIDKVCTAYK